MKDKKSIVKSGCITTSVGCIQWDLPAIPCLGIETGDTLDEITFAITKKICELSSPLDLSNVSVQCLVDKLNAVEPLNKTIPTYLQLIIDNECKLSDLITAIQNQIDDIINPSLVLDLKCLNVNDSFGNPLPYTIQTVLQSLITEACNIRNQIAGLNGSITDLQQQIDALPAPYTEPLLTSCVYTARPTSTALNLLASDYCTYKTVVGTSSDIQTAIGRQCSSLDEDFVADANFIQSVTNLAQSENNQWVVLCNMYNRIIALEACACKVTCKDIILGFTTTFNDDSTVTLKFTSGSGAYIPTGFTDCGSTITIKNDNGVSTSPISIVIAQEASTIDLDISMFQAGEYLTFNLDAHLCSSSFNCSKCYSKVVRNTSGCCLVTNNGTDNITIIYKTCGLPA